MIRIPVSVGELIDKITILEIKIEKIKDEAKRANCRKEWEMLSAVAEEADLSFPKEKAALKKVNQDLWKIEDQLRKYEKQRDFSARFTELARQVYLNNDRRAELKRQINLASGSEIIEEKDYEEYTEAGLPHRKKAPKGKAQPETP